MYEVKHYVDVGGRNLFMDWRNQIKDIRTKIAIDKRIDRLELGNFGDHKICRDKIWELRINI